MSTSYEESKNLYSGSGEDHSVTPNSFDNLPVVPEDSEEIRRPNYGDDRIRRGLTSGVARHHMEEDKVEVDVEDMMDAGKGSKHKSNVKKLKNKIKKGGDEDKKEDQKEARANPKEKLARVSKRIMDFAKNKPELERIAKEDGNQDPNMVSSLKKEKEKNSNANFLSKLAETENNYGELTYGSYIILNIEDENVAPKKLTTKFRISDKAISKEMPREDYDQNCVFRIIPAAQHNMMTNMLHLFDHDDIPHNVQIDYENFMSEMEANVDLQDDFMGKQLKYGNKFQLVQESSKRFLALSVASNNDVKKIFTNEGYIDSYCLKFGFSEYPSSLTHFSFKECSSFQREGAGTVKDNHYVYLSTMYKGKTMFAKSIGQNLVMTQTYKSPINYDLVRESDTFDEIEDVQSSEVVLLTYANDGYYLNVPHHINKETGKYEEQNIIFESWQDYKDIDFNGWFMLEYDEDSKQVHLKHFNTGKYMAIMDSENDGEDYATLSEEKIKQSDIIFQPISSDKTDVMKYTTETIFKIRASAVGSDRVQNYLRFANEADKDAIHSRSNKEAVFGESSSNTNFLVVREPCPVNNYDTFNLVFPKDDTYRELVFCKDTHTHLNVYMEQLKNAENLIEKLTELVSGLYKTFDKVYRFLINQLEGRTNADYDIGEIVEYRQHMVAKVGILETIFELLEV